MAREFGVKKPDRILERTRDAIADWERYGERYGVPDGVVSGLRVELDKRAAILGGETL